MLLADITASKEIPWWQVAAGILAIPAAIAGLAYTFYSIKKLRLEIAKLEKESKEKPATTGKQPISNALLKELILRNEIRSLQDRQFSLLQWGLITLIAIEVALFFVRQQTQFALISSGTLTPNSPLPFFRYIQGTAFLCCVAIVFTYLLRGVSNRYNQYRSQLYAQAGIPHASTSPGWRRLLTVVFMIIPVMDLMVRFYLSVRFEIIP